MLIRHLLQSQKLLIMKNFAKILQKFCSFRMHLNILYTLSYCLTFVYVPTLNILSKLQHKYYVYHIFALKLVQITCQIHHCFQFLKLQITLGKMVNKSIILLWKFAFTYLHWIFTWVLKGSSPTFLWGFLGSIQVLYFRIQWFLTSKVKANFMA